MKPQSLSPYDENYILMYKRTLIVNSMILTAMCGFIANMSDFSDDEVALMFGDSANKVVASMTDDEVNEVAHNLIADSVLNNGASSVAQYKHKN